MDKDGGYSREEMAKAFRQLQQVLPPQLLQHDKNMHSPMDLLEATREYLEKNLPKVQQQNVNLQYLQNCSELR